MKLAIKENAQENKYQLLGRLVSDCKYYLGGGYGAEKHLWAKSVEDQIAKMKEIYNSLDVKPEWLTMQDIEHYEKEMKKVKSSKNESLSISKTIKEQKADIEVENPGILEVPEGKNVEDLPIKHFVDIANRKGLSTVTRALNNLQVWNKNKNKSLSKWAGDMIDKVNKRFENQKKNESLKRLNEATLQDWQDTIMKEVYNVLRNNKVYADVYEDYNFTDDNSFVMCVEINDGDWKHEHRRADLIISDLLDNYDNISVTKMKEEVTDDSEDDTYSAIHKYMIIKSDDITEDCCDEDILTEFSSNYADTEFDEVEFYSDTLRDISSNKIATAIETGCDFDINIYDVEIDTVGTMIISYEVKEEDYNPDVIESTIISILERMEDRIRHTESYSRRNRKSFNKRFKESVRHGRYSEKNILNAMDALGYRMMSDSYVNGPLKFSCGNGWTHFTDWDDLIEYLENVIENGVGYDYTSDEQEYLPDLVDDILHGRLNWDEYKKGAYDF